jgi:hypothetical protein
LKKLLSLPMNVATPVIYLLTGHLPIEGQIDNIRRYLYSLVI